MKLASLLFLLLAVLALLVLAVATSSTGSAHPQGDASVSEKLKSQVSNDTCSSDPRSSKYCSYSSTIDLM